MKKRFGIKFLIIAGCVLSAVGALATIGETWYLAQIVDVLGKQGSQIWFYLVCVLGMVLLEYLSNTMGIWVKHITQRRVMMEIRSALYEKMINVEYLQLKKRSSGDLNSLFLSDAEVIGKYYKTLMDSFGGIAGGVTALLICISLSWKFLLISLCILPIMLLVSGIANKNLKKYAYEVQQKKGASATALLDTIRNKNVGRSYSAQEYMIAHFSEFAVAENQAAVREARKRGGAMIVNRFCGSLPYVAIFIVGGILIFTQEISVGDFFAFAYIFSNVQSLQNILEINTAKKSYAAAWKRLNDLLMQPDAECEGKNEGCLEYREGLNLYNVSFAYEGAADILCKVNLHVKKGETIGIIGESGVGKSTLLGILMGLLTPKSGGIRYCSRNDCYEGRAYRDRLAVVFQDNFLFPVTIRENLLVGKPDATEAELVQACENAGILDDIRKMRHGLDTSVSELGYSLSGGQRQRICIARALLKRPEILIMDEPSASLDTIHEAQLMKKLSIVMKEGILIVVSHRKSTIEQLQTVYILENSTFRKVEA